MQDKDQATSGLDQELASATDHLESAVSTLSPVTQQVRAEDALKQPQLHSVTDAEEPGVIVYNKKKWNIQGIDEDKVSLQLCR